MLPFPAAGWAPSLPTSGMQHGSGPWSSQVSSIPHHTQCYIPNQRLANRITMEFPPRLKARICFGSSCCIWISTSWLKQVLQRQKPAKRAADAQACREADSTQETNKPSHTWASKLCRLHTLKFSAFSPKITCAHRSFSPASSPSPWRPPCAQLFVNKITARCLNPRHSLSPNKHFHMIVLFQHYQKIHLSPSSCFTQAACLLPEVLHGEPNHKTLLKSRWTSTRSPTPCIPAGRFHLFLFVQGETFWMWCGELHQSSSFISPLPPLWGTSSVAFCPSMCQTTLHAAVRTPTELTACNITLSAVFFIAHINEKALCLVKAAFSMAQACRRRARSMWRHVWCLTWHNLMHFCLARHVPLTELSSYIKKKVLLIRFMHV